MDNDQFIKTADRASIAYASAFFVTAMITVFATQGIAFGDRGVIGGDFLAFHTAGSMALSGDAKAAYDAVLFDSAMQARAPVSYLGMSWQYPPTVFFLAAPFALIPYKLSYVLWVLAGWAALVAVLHSVGQRHLGLSKRAVRILVLSPLCIAFISHGQINCLTAALIILAGFEPKSRWLVAGLAAGALTIKPQLGLLIPVAFVAVGAWRAIGVAAVSGLALHLPSLLVFGRESWGAFLTAIARFNAEIAGPAQSAPPRGMTTFFGQFRIMGLPSEAALMAHYGLAALIAIIVFIVWQRHRDPLARLSVLCTGTLLAAPYAYGYELTALIPAVLYLAGQAGPWRSVLGGYLLLLWGLVAARNFIPDLSWLNNNFAITLSVFLAILLTARPFTRNIEFRRAAA